MLENGDFAIVASVFGAVFFFWIVPVAALAVCYRNDDQRPSRPLKTSMARCSLARLWGEHWLISSTRR